MTPRFSQPEEPLPPDDPAMYADDEEYEDEPEPEDDYDPEDEEDFEPELSDVPDSIRGTRHVDYPHGYIERGVFRWGSDWEPREVFRWRSADENELYGTGPWEWTPDAVEIPPAPPPDPAADNFEWTQTHEDVDQLLAQTFGPGVAADNEGIWRLPFGDGREMQVAVDDDTYTIVVNFFNADGTVSGGHEVRSGTMDLVRALQRLAAQAKGAGLNFAYGPPSDKRRARLYAEALSRLGYIPHGYMRGVVAWENPGVPVPADTQRQMLETHLRQIEARTDLPDRYAQDPGMNYARADYGPQTDAMLRHVYNLGLSDYGHRLSHPYFDRVPFLALADAVDEEFPGNSHANLIRRRLGIGPPLPLNREWLEINNHNYFPHHVPPGLVPPGAFHPSGVGGMFGDLYRPPPEPWGEDEYPFASFVRHQENPISDPRDVPVWSTTFLSRRPGSEGHGYTFELPPDEISALEGIPSWLFDPGMFRSAVTAQRDGWAEEARRNRDAPPTGYAATNYGALPPDALAALLTRIRDTNGENAVDALALADLLDEYDEPELAWLTRRHVTQAEAVGETEFPWNSPAGDIGSPMPGLPPWGRWRVHFGLPGVDGGPSWVENPVQASFQTRITPESSSRIRWVADDIPHTDAARIARSLIRRGHLTAPGSVMQPEFRGRWGTDTLESHHMPYLPEHDEPFEPYAGPTPAMYGPDEDRLGFEQSLLDNPWDGYGHQVYADWLDENGHPAEAALRRRFGTFLAGEHGPANSPDGLPFYTQGDRGLENLWEIYMNIDRDVRNWNHTTPPPPERRPIPDDFSSYAQYTADLTCLPGYERLPGRVSDVPWQPMPVSYSTWEDDTRAMIAALRARYRPDPNTPPEPPPPPAAPVRRAPPPPPAVPIDESGEYIPPPPNPWGDFEGDGIDWGDEGVDDEPFEIDLTNEPEPDDLMSVDGRDWFDGEGNLVVSVRNRHEAAAALRRWMRATRQTPNAWIVGNAGDATRFEVGDLTQDADEYARYARTDYGTLPPDELAAILQSLHTSGGEDFGAMAGLADLLREYDEPELAWLTQRQLEDREPARPVPFIPGGASWGRFNARFGVPFRHRDVGPEEFSSVPLTVNWNTRVRPSTNVAAIGPSLVWGGHFALPHADAARAARALHRRGHFLVGSSVLQPDYRAHWGEALNNNPRLPYLPEHDEPFDPQPEPPPPPGPDDIDHNAPFNRYARTDYITPPRGTLPWDPSQEDPQFRVPVRAIHPDVRWTRLAEMLRRHAAVGLDDPASEHARSLMLGTPHDSPLDTAPAWELAMSLDPRARLAREFDWNALPEGLERDLALRRWMQENPTTIGGNPAEFLRNLRSHWSSSVLHPKLATAMSDIWTRMGYPNSREMTGTMDRGIHQERRRTSEENWPDSPVIWDSVHSVSGNALPHRTDPEFFSRADYGFRTPEELSGFRHRLNEAYDQIDAEQDARDAEEAAARGLDARPGRFWPMTRDVVEGGIRPVTVPMQDYFGEVQDPRELLLRAYHEPGRPHMHQMTHTGPVSSVRTDDGLYEIAEGHIEGRPVIHVGWYPAGTRYGFQAVLSVPEAFEFLRGLPNNLRAELLAGGREPTPEEIDTPNPVGWGALDDVGAFAGVPEYDPALDAPGGELVEDWGGAAAPELDIGPDDLLPPGPEPFDPFDVLGDFDIGPDDLLPPGPGHYARTDYAPDPAAGFHKAILDTSGQDTAAALAYADYLDEMGQHEQAWIIRQHVQTIGNAGWISPYINGPPEANGARTPGTWAFHGGLWGMNPVQVLHLGQRSPEDSGMWHLRGGLEWSAPRISPDSLQGPRLARALIRRGAAPSGGAYWQLGFMGHQGLMTPPEHRRAYLPEHDEPPELNCRYEDAPEYGDTEYPETADRDYWRMRTPYGPEEERAGFEHKIQHNPFDPTNHLVMGDWWDERGGDPVEAEFRRAMGEWVQRPGAVLPIGNRVSATHPYFDPEADDFPWAIPGNMSWGPHEGWGQGTARLPGGVRPRFPYWYRIPPMPGYPEDPGGVGIWDEDMRPLDLPPEQVPHAARWRANDEMDPAQQESLSWRTWNDMEEAFRRAFRRHRGAGTGGRG